MPRRFQIALRSRPLRVLLSLVFLAIVTLAALRIFHVNATTAGFAYLLLVLIIAILWGFVEASILSVAASLTLNFFFFPPVGTFNITDSNNWVALFSFLCTSLIASRLSAEVKRKASDAIQRQQDIERLYSFSRAILLIDNAEPFPTQLIRKLADIFQLSSASLYDRRSGDFYRAGSPDLDDMDEQLRDVALQGTSYSNGQSGRVSTAVRLGSQPIASLAIQGPPMPDSVLQGIANLIAIGLERARAQDLAQQIEAARQSEQLRSTLIDAMAHEFKTPLTSIKAATTALLASPEQAGESRMEILKIADEEADHLTKLIDDTVAMARLDTTHIEITPETSDIMEVIDEVVGSMKTEFPGHSVSVSNDEKVPRFAFDRQLIKLSLKQLIDNALKYSPTGTAIEIRASQSLDMVAVEITDHGIGIPKQEQHRIFERFFRSPSVQRQVPGSGLGLSIAYVILRAHHGDLTVSSEPGSTTFRMVLPLEYKGESIERGSNSRN
jgi:two-component system, OmpR family, sensor histidine kinase KdpD